MSIIVQEDANIYRVLYFCKLLEPVPNSLPHWKVAETVRAVPDGVITIICAPDDECSYHPKHVEQCTET
jgi:hypothetical protein